MRLEIHREFTYKDSLNAFFNKTRDVPIRTPFYTLTKNRDMLSVLPARNSQLMAQDFDPGSPTFGYFNFVLGVDTI